MSAKYFGAAGILFAGIAIACATAVCQDQPLSGSPRQSVLKTDAVEYIFPEQVTVPAGKASPVALHFRIKQNLHINSNKPRAEYLIPTVFSIPDASKVRLADANYPTGTEYALPSAPDEKLLVYSGEFVIEAKIVATTGNHLVEAKLRYQACDQSECLPPKTITVPIDVIGK